MADGTIYLEKFLEDIPMQFKDKPGIKVLVEALSKQLQEVYDFYQSLPLNVRIDTAQGKQLDLIGDIVCLSRAQAGLYLGDPIPISILDDETYRIYLKYKILLNTSDCTYRDLMDGLTMFIDDVVYYREDPEMPARIIFRATSDVAMLLSEMPLVRAAGVGIHIEVQDSEVPYTLVPVFSVFVDDTYVYNWTQDEMKNHVEGHTLILTDYIEKPEAGVIDVSTIASVSGNTINIK